MSTANKLVIGVVLLILVIIPHITSDYIVYVVTLAMLFSMLTASYDLMPGYTGPLSFCPAAFYGLGAYSSALLTLNTGMSFWLALPVSTIGVFLFAVVVGSPQSPGTTFFGKDSFDRIRCPLVLVTGSKDVQKRYDAETMPASTRREVFALLPPGQKVFVWLENADHMAFGDGAPSLPRRSRARDDTHRITRALTVAAADRFLKNKPEAAAAMKEAYARTLLGRVVSDLEWLEK